MNDDTMNPSADPAMPEENGGGMETPETPQTPPMPETPAKDEGMDTPEEPSGDENENPLG